MVGEKTGTNLLPENQQSYHSQYVGGIEVSSVRASLQEALGEYGPMPGADGEAQVRRLLAHIFALS
jgi:hypothetical protein